MKSVKIILLLIFFQIFFLFSQTNTSLYPPEIKKIIENGKIIVAMHTKNFQPFIMLGQDGELVGNDIELAKGIAKELGVKLEITRAPQTFNEVADYVANGKADIAISLLSITLARAEKVRYSDPYLVLHPTLLLNRLTVSKYLKDGSMDAVEILQKVKGLKIAEPKGNSYVDIAKNIFPNATIVIKENWDEVMNAVYNGLVDVVIRDEIGVKNYIFKNPEQSVQLQTITLLDEKFNDPLGIALPAKSTHFVEWINLYLKKYNKIKNANDLIRRYAKYYEK